MSEGPEGNHAREVFDLIGVLSPYLEPGDTRTISELDNARAHVVLAGLPPIEKVRVFAEAIAKAEEEQTLKPDDIKPEDFA